MRLTQDEANAKIVEAKEWIASHGCSAWRHFKGGIYEIMGLTLCADTCEVLVRYREIAGLGGIKKGPNMVEWSRKFSEWKETVGQPVNGDFNHRDIKIRIPRFEPVHRVQCYMSDAEIEGRTDVSS